MYFPYLRGRQYELIALRELNIQQLLGNCVIPIVEPVKLSSTLCSTIESYAEKAQPLALIHNPSVGSLMSEIDEDRKNSNVERFGKLLMNSKITKAHQMNRYSSIQLSALNELGIRKDDMLILNTDQDCMHIYETEFSSIEPKYTCIPDESSFRRKVCNNRVLIDDKFIKQERNAEYKNKEDEFFSDDHLFYKDDGFLGFADYSIIGDTYLEKGFAPYAVAIHIVYFDKDKNLRIHHFVSDSNSYNDDTAGKFYEAVKKLAEWHSMKPIDESIGLQTLLDYYEKGTYPGLGTVKKLSVMHHLEIMGRYLSFK